jgi:hypothetical protein
MRFQVVRQEGTPGAENSGLTPIPGLRVQIHEEVETTPIAVHEVLTDKDGYPVTAVEVDSAADILILSQDEAIAKFQAAGQASEFAAPLEPTIVATPMVEATGVCIASSAGTPVAEFRYNNFNESGVVPQVPITGLSPELYGTPDSTSDDLLLNAIRNSAEDPIIPDASYRAVAPDDNKQIFESGGGMFNIPYTAEMGPVTWSFLGKQLTVDASTKMCEEPGIVQCQRLSSADVQRIVTNLRSTVTATLRAAARVMKLGSSPYLKTSAAAIKRVIIKSAELEGAYICPQGVLPAPSCVRRTFPASELAKIHDSIFRRPSPVRKQMFNKFRKSYNKRYQQFLVQTFPDEIVMCPK